MSNDPVGISSTKKNKMRNKKQNKTKQNHHQRETILRFIADKQQIITDIVKAKLNNKLFAKLFLQIDDCCIY